MNVAVPHRQVLLAHPVQDVGPLRHDLEQPRRGAAGGVLGREQKGKERLRDLVVGEHPQHGRGLRDAVGRTPLLLSLAPRLGVDHGLDPGVHDAVGLAAGGHADLALGGARRELGKNNIGGLLPVPRLGVGEDDGEVDELQGGGDEVVVVGDPLDGVVGDVVADKGAAGHGAHELAELGHEGDGLAAGVLGDLEELFKVGPVHLLLAGQVAVEGPLGEEAVEALAEVDVGLAVQEDEVIGSEELVGDIDDAGLDVRGRVEDLAGHVPGRGDDDEPVAVY